MIIFGVFNTKGGVGKSTVTTVLADFFASNLRIKSARKNVKKVLVVDLDRQGSVSNALLGKEIANRVRANRKTAVHFAMKLIKGEDANINHYAIPRALHDGRGKSIRLRDLKVLVPDDEMIDQFNERVDKERLPGFTTQLRKSLKSSKSKAVFIDFPAGVSRQDMLSVSGLAVCDFIIIPTEITELALDALPRTFQMIDVAHAMAAPKRAKKPKALGILPTKANATHGQYQRHFNDLERFAATQGVTLFERHIPHSPSLANATDDTIKDVFLKDRYGTAYDKSRLVAWEAARRAKMS